jgi:hypothetical protein
MKKYPAPSQPNEAPLHDCRPEEGTLELPVDKDFISEPPRIDPQVMLKRIQETQPWRSSRPGEAERRAALKVAVEFVL